LELNPSKIRVQKDLDYQYNTFKVMYQIFLTSSDGGTYCVDKGADFAFMNFAEDADESNTFATMSECRAFINQNFDRVDGGIKILNVFNVEAATAMHVATGNVRDLNLPKI
jgi:hypothetical protein